MGLWPQPPCSKHLKFKFDKFQQVNGHTSSFLPTTCLLFETNLPSIDEEKNKQKNNKNREKNKCNKDQKWKKSYERKKQLTTFLKGGGKY